MYLIYLYSSAQNMKKLFLLGLFTVSGFVLLTVTKSSPVFAAAGCSWNGSISGTWGNAANWDSGCTGAGGIPGTGDSLNFPNGATTLSMNNNLLSDTYNSLTFDDNYTLGGNPFSIDTGGITVNSGNVVISAGADIALANDTFFETVGGTLDVQSDIDINGANFTLN